MVPAQTALTQRSLRFCWHRGVPSLVKELHMEKSDLRQVSLAGLRLIGAGAVLGLALTAPASSAQAAPPRPSASPVAEHDVPNPDR
jgi:hypothetical protein